MATSTIPAIARTVTSVGALAADEYLETGSISVGSSGKILAKLLATGGVVASGVFVLNSATATIFTINYGATLTAAPSAFRLTFGKPTTGGNNIGGNWVDGSITTSQFQIQLDGPTGDTNHKVYWEAIA